MIRRIAVAATAVAFGLGGLAVAGSSVAGAAKPPPFNATGTVGCGAGEIKPRLRSNTPQAGTRRSSAS
jgi:hypothetical protein